MYALDTLTKCKVSNATLRYEKHGKEDRPIIDLTLLIELQNTALDMFFPGLMSSFYLPDDSGNLTRLRYPVLGKLSLITAYVNRDMTLDYGLGESMPLPFEETSRNSNIELSGCKMDRFIAALLDGGSILLQHRLTLPQLPPDQIGFFASVGKKTVFLKLPPSGEVSHEQEPQGDGAQGELDDGSGEEHEGDNDSATEAFIAAHAGAGA